MHGKEKCERLRELRRLFCLRYGIPFTEEPCASSGDGCIGTCPKCDQALRSIAAARAARVRSAGV